MCIVRELHLGDNLHRPYHNVGLPSLMTLASPHQLKTSIQRQYHPPTLWYQQPIGYLNSLHARATDSLPVETTR
jgi:hypothetical protein